MVKINLEIIIKYKMWILGITWMFYVIYEVT
jgi:hypothetical protein